MTTEPLSPQLVPISAHRRVSPVFLSVAFRGVLRWSLIAILVGTGAWKLLDLTYFEQVVKSGGFIRGDFVPWVARGIPIGEILIALALCLPRAELLGACLAAFLSAAFAGFHFYLFSNGIVIPCGCAGIRETLPRSSDHLWMMAGCIGMLAASVYLLFACPVRRIPGVSDQQSKVNSINEVTDSEPWSTRTQ